MTPLALIGLIIVGAWILVMLIYIASGKKSTFELKEYYLRPQRGLEKALAGDLDDAEQEFNEAIQENPKFLPAYLHRAFLYLNRGDYDAAIADYDLLIAASTEINKDLSLSAQVASLGPTHREELYLNRGIAKCQKGDYAGAIADFTETLRLNPQQLPALFNRGLAYMRKGDLDEAITDCTVGIRLAPNDPFPYMNRAAAFRLKGELDKALEDCERVIRLDHSQETQVYVERAIIRMLQGDYHAALTDCNKSIELYPQSPHPFYTRGTVWHYLKEWDKAVDDFSQAIELNHPDLSDAYLLRAHAHSRTGNEQLGLEDYTSVIQLEPEHGIAYNNRGYHYAVNGELEKALADCNRAIELDPQSVYCYGSRGFTYFLMGKYVDALVDFRKALEVKSDHPFAIAGSAITLSVLGEVDDARKMWHSLVQIDAKYQNADALQEEYQCGDVFVEAARTLISTM